MAQPAIDTINTTATILAHSGETYENVPVKLHRVVDGQTTFRFGFASISPVPAEPVNSGKIIFADQQQGEISSLGGSVSRTQLELAFVISTALSR